MPARHHIPQEFLIDYASGALSEAMSLLVASHLTLCPLCRGLETELETVGGTLLQNCPPTPLSDACKNAVMAALDALTPSCPCAASPAPANYCRILPHPLRAYTGCSAQEIQWKRVIPGVWRSEFIKDGDRVSEMPVGSIPRSARLIRIAAGRKLPRHRHDADEAMLVLAGAVRVDGTLYRRGDVVFIEAGQEHHPIVEKTEDCLTLIVTEGPVHMTGPIGRFVDKFVKL